MSGLLIGAQGDYLAGKFQFNEAAFRHLLEGAVVADLVKRAIRVEAVAKLNASQSPRWGPNSGSEPGHGPAVRTGRLRASIRWSIPGSDDRGAFVDIGSNVVYAPFVELGTSRMAARPYLRPALEAARGT